MYKPVIWAIIPARSGSKGLPNKNIKNLAGIPLIAHTINFAFNSRVFSRVLLSTDSLEYAEIGKSFGAWVPFLRSSKASADTSMEEDILLDLDRQLNKINIQKPDILVWLRPTFPFRGIQDLNKGLELLSQDIQSVRLVIPAEPRLYYDNEGYLEPYSFKSDKSMIRRQTFPSTYSVFHTDIFWYKNIELGERFLGNKIRKVVINKFCSFDIDGIEDFEIIDAIIKSNVDILSNYLHLRTFK
jgi:CMP-N-acetylneuraminic acid synthetase